VLSKFQPWLEEMEVAASGMVLRGSMWMRGAAIVSARDRRNSFAGLENIESSLLPDTHRFSGGPRRFNKRCLAQSDSRRSLAGTIAVPLAYFMTLLGVQDCF
jgi:hypothetical protein